MFEIESGVEIPATKRSVTRKYKYPWDQLSVGQRFVIPADKAPSKGVSSISPGGRQWAKRNNPDAKFKAVKLENGDIGVWRVE